MSAWSNKSWLDVLLLLCRWLAVSPSKPSKNQRRLHLLRSFTVLGSVWICSILRLCTIKFETKVFAIEKLLYLAEYPLNMFITAIFSLGVYGKDDFYRRLWLQRMRLQTLLLEQAEPAEKPYGKLGQRLLFILGFHFVCLLLDLWWLNFDWLLTIPSNCAHNLPGLMISLSLLQYVLAMRLLCLLHKQLNKRLEQLQSAQGSISILATPADVVALQLEQLRLVSSSLDVLHAQLLHKFGLVLLINFGNSLLCFCYELFIVFRFLEHPQWSSPGWQLFLYRILWLLMHGARISSVLVANERIAEQKCQLCLLLNQLEACNTRLERAINRFLLQLQSNDGQSWAVCGVVELDTLALGGFISALMAIVIFLIQIDLGNKSLMGYSF